MLDDIEKTMKLRRWTVCKIYLSILLLYIIDNKRVRVEHEANLLLCTPIRADSFSRDLSVQRFCDLNTTYSGCRPHCINKS